MKFKLCVSFFLIFLTIGFNSFAQEKTDYQILLDSVDKHVTTDTSKTLALTKKYITKAKKENKRKELFNAYYLIANDIYFQNDFLDQAYDASSICIEFSKKELLYEELIKSYLLRALIIMKKSNWTDIKVLTDYGEALKVAKHIDNFYWEHTILGRMSSFHTISGNIDEAIKIQKLTVNALKKVEFQKDYKKYKKWGLYIRDYYNYITKAYILKKEKDSAFKYNELFFKRLPGHQFEYWKREYYINKGEIELLKESPIAARNNFLKGYNCKIPERINLLEDRTFQKSYHFGRVAYLEKKYKKAIEILEKGHGKDSVVDHVEYIFYNEYYEYLSKAYLKINDIKKAEYYFNKHLSLLSTTNNIQNNFKLKFKELEIEKYNNEIDKAKKRVSDQKKITITALTVSILLLTGYFVYNRRKQIKNKRKFNELINKIEELKNKDLLIEESRKKTQSNQNLKTSEIQRIISALEEFIEEEQFLNIDCTLSTTAKKLKTNTTYLSKVINSEYHKNFSSYLNELRVNYALKRLQEDKMFRRYSIQSIANELGYKSKESFNKAFRSQTGILPSYFIKQIEREHS